jgi:hypothetical protein
MREQWIEIVDDERDDERSSGLADRLDVVASTRAIHGPQGARAA